jgi:hypothetical protein
MYGHPPAIGCGSDIFLPSMATRAGPVPCQTGAEAVGWYVMILRLRNTAYGLETAIVGGYKCQTIERVVRGKQGLR